MHRFNLSQSQLILGSVLSAVLLVSGLPASAQREAVKRKAGDASAEKTAPPSKTPGGADYVPKKGSGPAKGGHETAGAGTMATTDTEDSPMNGPGRKGDTARGGEGGKGEEKADKVAYDFGLPSEDGKNIPIAEYKGKVLLIVNLARESSYAEQLPALNKLTETFKDKGLVIIGVPSNDFGNAEPGTEAEVAKAYTDAKVNFLVTARSEVIGVHQLPLFGYLAKNKAVPEDGLHWAYTKFIVDRKGKVILRFGPDAAPDSLEVQAALQEVLDGTWKPTKSKPADGGDEGEPPSM